MNILPLNGYSDAINLNQPFDQSNIASLNKDRIVDTLYTGLLGVLKDHTIINIEQLSGLDKRQCIEVIITLLEPNTLSDSLTKALGQLLELEKYERGMTSASLLSHAPFFSIGRTKIVLWRGDITTLECDAIVNAANNQLLGCFRPFHHCIDNAIHNRAGVQLRADCNTIIQLQGNLEPTAQAKITRAYHLPARYVIHSVGPIVSQTLTARDKLHLRHCYRSILALVAQKTDIHSLALCSISTGVFGFPIEEAAPIAIDTVTHALRQNKQALDMIIFNVFSEHDFQIYQSAMEDYVICQR